MIRIIKNIIAFIGYEMVLEMVLFAQFRALLSQGVCQTKIQKTPLICRANMEVLDLDVGKLRGEGENVIPEELVTCCAKLQAQPELLRGLVTAMPGIHNVSNTCIH